MAATKSRPAVSALGVRWRLGRPPGRRELAAVVAAAGVDAKPVRNGTAPRAVRLRQGQAAWLLGGRAAAARAKGAVVVVAAAVVRVAVAGGEPVWVGPGEVATVPVGEGAARVEAARPPRCAPVLARKAALADALLGAPGVNLAVTDAAVAGWTDAVVVAAGGDFVCPCGARFASIRDINDHYAVKLVGDCYAPLLPEAPDQRPAGVYTPPPRRIAAGRSGAESVIR